MDAGNKPTSHCKRSATPELLGTTSIELTIHQRLTVNAAGTLYFAKSRAVVRRSPDRKAGSGAY